MKNNSRFTNETKENKIEKAHDVIPLVCYGCCMYAPMYELLVFIPKLISLTLLARKNAPVLQ